MPVGYVLRRIRELRNLEALDVATSTGISVKRFADFESGKRSPSYSQLERLAEIYGVPPYALGAKDVPNLPELIADFRTSRAAPAQLSPSGLKRLWGAETRSQFCRQLAAEVKLDVPEWLSKVPKGELEQSHARNLRSYFDDWLAKRQDRFDFVGSKEQVFMQCFRVFMEVQGLAVNVNDASPDDFLGFYIRPDDGVPLAFVNRKISSKKAQLFTLLHETCHHFENKEGVSNPFVIKNSAERRCNRFAAEFLAPRREFASLVSKFRKPKNNDDLIDYVNAVSRASLLSRQAALIRLFEEEYITVNQMRRGQSVFARTPKSEKEEEKSAARGPQHAKRIGELGYLPIYLAAIAVDRKLIDSIDVKNGLKLAENTQAKAFDLVKRRLNVALSS